MDEDKRQRNFPEENDGGLDCSSLVVCCAFNRYGTFLAGGCNDGKVFIWDFLTRFEVREITAHSGHPLTSMSWSRYGLFLATSSLDNTLAVWNVRTKELIVRWFCKTPVMKVQFNPRNEDLLLACPYKHPPLLLKINSHDEIPSVQTRQLPVDEEDDIESNIIASFDRRGENIYTGNVKGRITIIKFPSFFSNDDADSQSQFQIVSSFKLQQYGASPPAIRDIEFAPKDKRYFLVNSTDRAIRLFSCDNAMNAGVNGNCEELRKFQEVVTKPLWRRCCFSGENNVTYVCGASARQHDLYIWDIETGAVTKMLTGASKGEAVLDVQWHPTKPIVVSVANGIIYFWSRAEVENWSAYAPAFKELDENQEYCERESEFDIEDEDSILKPDPKGDNESDDDISIEVNEIDFENDYHLSSDEESCDLKQVDLKPLQLQFSDVEKAI